MTWIDMITVIILALCVALCVYVVFTHYLRKEFDTKLEAHKKEMHKLSEYYINFHKEYAEHIYKYH